MKGRARRVSFSENISTVKSYEYFRDDDNEEKMGKDWQKTMDLSCREFFMPIENGGCGGKWMVFQEKVDKLGEPCWRMIGQLWNRLFPNRKRLEEESDDESDDESNKAVCMCVDESDIESDDDNEVDNNVVFSFYERK